MFASLKGFGRFLFGTSKGKAIMDGTLALVWIGVGCVSDSTLLDAMCALNAALFGASAGFSLARHLYEPLVEDYRGLLDRQDEAITSLYREVIDLREKDAS